jgi:glycosyltransferase involved in cell wall biosynthesis
MPIISIIVPVYKVEPYLRRCIDSILAQTFTDFECILINDGSPDNCPVICDEYAKKDGRVVVIHQENKGVSAARNAGLDKAKGEWIGFVDSDDWCDEGMFQFLYENAIKYDADISIGGFRTVSSDGNAKNIKHKKSIHILNGNEAIIKMFAPSAFGGYSWNKFIKSSLLNHLRYDESKKYMEDVLLFYTLFKYVKRIIYVDIPYYNYVSNTESITRQWGLTESAETALCVLDTIISIEPNKKIKRKVIHTLARFKVEIGIHYIKMKDVINDNYAFLRKDLKDNLFSILVDFTIPVKEKIRYVLVLYPKLWHLSHSIFVFVKEK